MKILLSTALGLLIAVTTLGQNSTINTSNTRLLAQPSISDSHIAFIYAEDLWVADKDGSNPKRLTIDRGVESNPVFSPDGKTIAFSASYDGNIDIFSIPTTGGIPKRLTYHPGREMALDFTPDGKSILFLSQRKVFTNRHMQLFTVGLDGGKITQLPIPRAFWATYNSNGSKIAYTPSYEVFNQWKHYRGGTESKIWIFDTKTYDIVEIPKPQGGANDTRPQWIGEKVFFRSDRDGEFNIYSYDPNSKSVTQHTSFKDFPVLDFASNGKEILFQQAGYLHTLNPTSNATQQLKIGIATDLLELRPRFVSGKQYIRSGSVSPTAARIVVDFRGDIITVPAEKGDANNITNSSGAHEKEPAWSPDGKTIAYFSDESGEYALHLYDQNEQSATKKIPLNGAGFYANIHWSPDSRKLAFVDNSRSLYIFNRDSNKTTKVASDVLYTPGVFRELFGDWSHDSNWIVYTLISDTNFERAYLYSLKDGKSYPVSDGYSNVSDPTFDASGKYLYMTASTDAGPVVNWFDQSNQDMEFTNNIYLVTLQKDVTSPFFKENDVEIIQKEEKEEAKKKRDEENLKEPEKPSFKIDIDGLDHRIIDIPLPPGLYHSLSSPKEGELVFIEETPHSQQPGKLKKYSLKDKKAISILDVNGYELAANGEKAFYYANGGWGITTLTENPEKKPINVDGIKVKIDPQAEFRNIFNEAWRVNRDYFYDPGMHGVDWIAAKKKYEQFLPDVAAKSDLYDVMQWMFSELGVGHHRFSSSGDSMNDTETIQGGLLGADLEIENERYRITKIYGGLNWNPNLRSPLTEPGVNVNVGDYILAIDGEEIKGTDNFFKFFENSADKIVTLTVSPTPNMKDSRKEKVTTIANEYALRNRDWVEGNIKKVHAATDGKVAYVWVPNTAYAGHEYFKRYFYPQADKQAIIVDERFNGGGQLADYVIDMLRKPVQSYWNFRYGEDLKAPNASIQGPKVMLIDEYAGSGGDYLPWMFRKFNVGTLIGTRTWGGLVGVLGYPEFIDGGSVTAPNVAFYSENGFRVENEGVAPDIEVQQTPKDVIAGKDPQLDKAIEFILNELKKNPPQKMPRPPYPIKTKN